MYPQFIIVTLLHEAEKMPTWSEKMIIEGDIKRYPMLLLPESEQGRVLVPKWVAFSSGFNLIGSHDSRFSHHQREAWVFSAVSTLSLLVELRYLIDAKLRL